MFEKAFLLYIQFSVSVVNFVMHKDNYLICLTTIPVVYFCFCGEYDMSIIYLIFSNLYEQNEHKTRITRLHDWPDKKNYHISLNAMFTLELHRNRIHIGCHVNIIYSFL